MCRTASAGVVEEEEADREEEVRVARQTGAGAVVAEAAGKEAEGRTSPVVAIKMLQGPAGTTRRCRKPQDGHDELCTVGNGQSYVSTIYVTSKRLSAFLSCCFVSQQSYYMFNRMSNFQA